MFLLLLLFSCLIGDVLFALDRFSRNAFRAQAFRARSFAGIHKDTACHFGSIASLSNMFDTDWPLVPCCSPSMFHNDFIVTKYVSYLIYFSPNISRMDRTLKMVLSGMLCSIFAGMHASVYRNEYLAASQGVHGCSVVIVKVKIKKIPTERNHMTCYVNMVEHNLHCHKRG